MVEDVNCKGWSTLYIICPTENGDYTKKVMEVTVKLINADSNAQYDKALIDGAHALKNAANSLGVDDRSCIIHGCHVPNSNKKNGKRGTKGSLCVYRSRKSLTERKVLSLTHVLRVSSNDVTVLWPQLLT